MASSRHEKFVQESQQAKRLIEAALKSDGSYPSIRALRASIRGNKPSLKAFENALIALREAGTVAQGTPIRKK